MKKTIEGWTFRSLSYEDIINYCIDAIYKDVLYESGESVDACIPDCPDAEGSGDKPKKIKVTIIVERD